MAGRKITVEGRKYEWTTAGILQPASLDDLNWLRKNGAFHGIVIWDENRRQYKAPLEEVTMDKDGHFYHPILPSYVAEWIKTHIKPF